MKDYYENVRNVIDEYNQIMDKISHSEETTTNDEDEVLQNFCIYLAHALIKDTGFGQQSREELAKVASIINDVIL